MRCPMCRTRLITLTRDDVETDYCPACQGVWLDGGELDAMAAQLRRSAGGGAAAVDEDGDDATPAAAEPDAGVLVWDAVFRRELQMLAPSELRRMSVDRGWPDPADDDDGDADDPVPGGGHVGPPCPVCDGTLTVSRRHGVRLDVCSTCRGIWFDPGELEEVLARVGPGGDGR